MRSVLWLPLVLSLSDCIVTEDESTGLDESESSSYRWSGPSFALADDVFSKQQECESIIGEAVDKVLDEGAYYKFPVPDDRYAQCKRILDEKKKEYIKTALVGLGAYETVFPLRLSSGRAVFLPIPVLTEENSFTDFDVQEELCATNSICLKISTRIVPNGDSEKYSNDQSERFSRCAGLLNDLKLKYIHVKKLDEVKLKKQRGLDVKCAGGPVTFFLPPQMNDLDSHTTSHSMGSKVTKINPVEGKTDEERKTVLKPESYDPYKNNYNDVVKELNPISEKRAKEAETSESDIENVTPSSESRKVEQNEKDSELSVKSSEPETTPQEVNNVKIGEAEVGGKENNAKNSESASSSKKESEDNITNKPSGDDEHHPENEQSSNKKGSEFENRQDTTTKPPKSTQSDEIQTSPNIKSKETNEEVKSTITTYGDGRAYNNRNVKMMTFRLKFVSRNSEGKVVKIQAIQRMKKTDRENIVPSSQRFTLEGGDDSITRTDFGLPKEFQDKETNIRKAPDSLEDNIIMMENDCKELLQFGEELLKHKMLSSLINFENQYNECSRKLDSLKKIYIEKYNLDVTTHKNIFPMTLPNGDQKLVLLPTQFLKTATVDQLSPSNQKPADVFEVAELHGGNSESTLKNRKPFDDPAFIPNDEFLESLQQGNAPADGSTLSKVASMLHMSGVHPDKRILE